MRLPDTWDLETELLIVGYGFAGGAAAIAAYDLGLRPLIIEKLEHPGGLSITAGGGTAIANDVDGVFECLKAACGGRTPDDVLRVFAQGLYDLKFWLEELAKSAGEPLEVEYSRGDAGYLLPGTNAFGSMKIKAFGSSTPFPWAKGLRGGARLFKLVYDNIERRQIPVMCRTSAKELIVNGDGEIVGAVIESEGKTLRVKASRAVILACGGYEFDEEMKRQYFQGMPIHGVTGRGNTGDGIRMAQKVGADLWHMWHYHGSYGFKPEGFPNAVRHPFAGPRKPQYRVPWIVVDKEGRRFMNELHPSPNDSNHRPMELFDPDRLDFPRIPSYAIFDDAGRRLGPVGFPIRTTDEDAQADWSEDNSREVQAGWILKAETLAELAEKINAEGHARVKPAVLAATVAEWNQCVENGSDPVHLRPEHTMHSVDTPPYYAIATWPIVSNTQGGPRHNADRQIVDPFGGPIPRLYSAGELGSIFGHLYLLSGNISECFISGRVAANHAATLQPWDVAAEATA